MHQAKWTLSETLCEEGIIIPPLPPLQKGGWRGFGLMCGKKGGVEVKSEELRLKNYELRVNGFIHRISFRNLRKEEDKKMFKRTSIFLCMLTLAIFLTATPSSAQQVRGVTDTEILIGQWGPQTGPAAPWGAVARGTDLLCQDH